uniref:BCLAF1 and THRAP3 family member 3 isoform X2 n=1 Tax=Solea senegalensis TaxID=28829 RepID=UPI001CD90930|nr:BCLAF1 and THRAP3 family member 3 isoform X2 [Solea senegalensis]
MSRPRSPHYRRFPWEEASFDSHKVIAGLGGNPQDRSHRPRHKPEEHWDCVREDLYPESQRRSPPLRDDRKLGHQRRPDKDEFYQRATPSPHYEGTSFDERRLPPLRNAAGDGDKCREQLWLVRERLPQAPRSHSDHQHREAGRNWSEEQGRGQGKFRDLSPAVRGDDLRGAGRERGRRNAQCPNRDRRREEPHQERSPAFKKQRRETDDTNNHLGYRNEEGFRDQHYSVDMSRDRFGGDTHTSMQPVRPLIIEHDHGIVESRKSPQWEQLDDRSNLNFNRQRGPRPLLSLPQRLKMPDNRSGDREDVRGRNFQETWRESNHLESRRSPALNDRANALGHEKRDGSLSHRWRGLSQPLRGNLNRGQDARTTPPLRNQPRSQKLPQGFQGLPREEQRPGYRAIREDGYDDPIAVEQDHTAVVWQHDRPRSLDQHFQRDDLDPKMPRGWSEKRSNSSNMASANEETLTIKVDMSRPVKQNSSLLYSSDRQLSLDLVNVGRQRLDFLPMLEHSGTYRETATHTGTFAQEIITLVHHVKEHYFRGDDITLNERFSAPQKGGYAEEETMELTLDERFSSNRGFSLNIDSLLDEEEEEEPLFSRLGSVQGLNQQPVRGPGDLRHDLERRRQERLEGVKVTIPGGSMSQRLHGPVSEAAVQYSDDMSPLEDDDGFSSWSEEQSRRPEGKTVVREEGNTHTLKAQRRGGLFYRQNTGFQRRNNRSGNRFGPVRRQSNNRNINTGPQW